MFLNQYRLIGDFVHAFAVLLLICHILKTRSCHAVSGITVILYAITFTFRYLDLFSVFVFINGGLLIYNTIFKIYYLFSTYLLLVLIYGVFRRTRDRAVETFPIFGFLIFAHLLTWMSCSMSQVRTVDKEFFWRFSIFLEVFAIIPQLTLIYKQSTISQAMTYYVTFMGSYRALYIANWIQRYNEDHFLDPIASFCGCMQTLVYLYFFVQIYPQLNKTDARRTTKPAEESKEDLIRKLNGEMPLIHNVI